MTISLHSHEECFHDRTLYAKNFKDIETESNRVKARRLLQPTGDRMLVVNPPFPTMSEEQIDRSFDLPLHAPAASEVPQARTDPGL